MTSKPAKNSSGWPPTLGDAATSWMDAPQVPQTRPCPQCEGKGTVPTKKKHGWHPCRFCKGTGMIPMEQAPEQAGR